ncbi:GGDEF domain-containing protein [Shewanella sp. OMA3-2]|uniref:GGDEF domain-containing protein n=1 Tax=Shewanella sp. OMA3-2 TaxID=2908650 RepID=UPI001F3A3492|nr:GGDEF domain-containing protein [Shewanella sp. OMA3-2]UJF21607.1 GGDEF domain-containing protein [Shewanella sp. OMA3-2]
MDAFTLHVSTAIVSAMMSISLLAFYIVGHRQRSLIDWSMAGGLFFASSCIGLLSYFFTIPYWLGPGLANACYILAHLGLLAGIRRHLQLTPQWHSMILIAAIVFLMHYVPGFLESLTSRLLYIYPLLMLINICTVLTIVLADKSRKIHAIYYPFMLAELIFFGQQLVRFIFVAFDQQLTLSIAGNRILQSSGTLAVFTFLMLMTLSCCLIVYRQQQLKLQDVTQVDPLTGLLNRQALPSRAKHVFELGRYQKAPMAIMIVEIDSLPKISEKYGYGGSDSVVKHVASVLEFTTRINSGIFRQHDNKFVLLFEEASTEQLQRLTARLQDKVASLVIKALHDDVRISINTGFAMQSDNDHSWQILMQQAERVLKQPIKQVNVPQPASERELVVDRFGFTAQKN